MATVSVRLVRLAFPGPPGVPVGKSIPLLAESKTSSGTSSAGSTAIGPDTNFSDLYWLITVSGGNVWMKFGADPTAAAGSDHLILDGAQDVAYAVSIATEKFAVIDA